MRISDCSSYLCSSDLYIVKPMLADEDTIIFQALVSPSTEFLGAKLLAVDRVAQTARFCFDARPEFANALGNIQGGFVAAILDETAGLTARLLTSAHIGVPTLDFRLTFFAPTKEIGRAHV